MNFNSNWTEEPINWKTVQSSMPTHWTVISTPQMCNAIRNYQNVLSPPPPQQPWGFVPKQLYSLRLQVHRKHTDHSPAIIPVCSFVLQISLELILGVLVTMNVCGQHSTNHCPKSPLCEERHFWRTCSEELCKSWVVALCEWREWNPSPGHWIWYLHLSWAQLLPLKRKNVQNGGLKKYRPETDNFVMRRGPSQPLKDRYLG